MSEKKLVGAWATGAHFNVGFSSAFVVDCVGRSEGLLLLWQEEWDVTVRLFSKGHIDAEIVSPCGTQ